LQWNLAVPIITSVEGAGVEGQSFEAGMPPNQNTRFKLQVSGAVIISWRSVPSWLAVPVSTLLLYRFGAFDSTAERSQIITAHGASVGPQNSTVPPLSLLVGNFRNIYWNAAQILSTLI
jgi:hypothetical protein